MVRNDSTVQLNAPKTLSALMIQDSFIFQPLPQI